MQDNKQFWEEQAIKYKDDVKAINFDNQEEDLEFFFLKKIFFNNEKVCDLGCGNGRTIFNMIKNDINSEFYGIDFTKGMIEIANNTKNKLNIKNANFFNLSATSEKVKDLFDFKFDKVLSKRLLINIKGEDKFKVIENIHSILKDNGIYVMIECFNEPLNKINKIRKEIDLEEIKVKSFNEYLTFDFLDKISDKFKVEEKIDFESLYYFISRVFNAHLSNGTPDYNAEINKLAVKLTKMGISPISGYSPQVMFILRKI